MYNKDDNQNKENKPDDMQNKDIQRLKEPIKNYVGNCQLPNFHKIPPPPPLIFHKQQNLEEDTTSLITEGNKSIIELIDKKIKFQVLTLEYPKVSSVLISKSILHEKHEDLGTYTEILVSIDILNTKENICNLFETNNITYNIVK